MGESAKQMYRSEDWSEYQQGGITAPYPETIRDQTHISPPCLSLSHCLCTFRLRVKTAFFAIRNRSTTIEMASASEARAALQRLEQEHGDLKTKLAIIRISEPISSEVPDSKPSPSKRGSDVSVSNLDNPTPATLEADLTHYKVRVT